MANTKSFEITSTAARSMSRFAFIAAYVIKLSARAEYRGRLSQRVILRGGLFVVQSGAARTEVYKTSDAALLFDYIRRTQLGTLVREAEDFRVEAFMERTQVAA